MFGSIKGMRSVKEVHLIAKQWWFIGTPLFDIEAHKQLKHGYQVKEVVALKQLERQKVTFYHLKSHLIFRLTTLLMKNSKTSKNV